jgi:HlyD family secretion protein
MLWSAVAVVAVGGVVAVALWPSTVVVDAAPVTRGPLQVTIDASGETRIHDRFIVSAPVMGRVARITLEPGDAVERGVTVIAEMTPEEPPLLDARTTQEAEAAVGAARGLLGRAQTEDAAARTALRQASAELERAQTLWTAGALTRQAYELRGAEQAAADERVRAAGFGVASAEAELARAQARLRRPAGGAKKAPVRITAPVTGVVLRRMRDSEGVVAPGEALVEIGDPRHLEVKADVLSTDAVGIRPGMPVSIEQWGGATPLRGRVERVDPSGFTKVSPLGVEEQRVGVTIDFENDRDAWTLMGDRFRVEVRIAVWEGRDVLQVPTSALFRTGDQWSVYVVDNGRARRRLIDVGRQTPTATEVTAGLDANTLVVVHPPDTVTDGGRIAVES